MKIDHLAPIKILSNGTFLNAKSRRTDHVAVLLPAAGIMVHPFSLGTPEGDELENQAACVEVCRNLRVLGFDDWFLALDEHWNHIITRTRYNPAVDTNLYPGIKPRWHWTNTDCAFSQKNAAGVPASAWLVDAGYGNVSLNPRNSSGFGLAVRRVGQ